jgi:hypothetical protein
MGGLSVLGTFVSNEARAQDARVYRGIITAVNADGSYQAQVMEQALVLPRLYRLAHDGHKLRPGEQVDIRAQGVLWEIL